MKKKTHVVLLLVVSLYWVIPVSLSAYNLRKIVNSEDLLSSTITSIYQDQRGLMWIGTNNGLNQYNGKAVSEFYPSVSGAVLTGSHIDAVTGMKNDVLWISTYHGLNRVQPSTGDVVLFPMFNRVSFAASDSRNNLFVIQGNSSIYYYQDSLGKFDQVYVRDLVARDILLFYIDASDRLWVFNNTGSIFCFAITLNTRGEIVLQPADNYTHETAFLYAFNDEGQLYFIDNMDRFWRFHTDRRQCELVADIKGSLAGKSALTAVMRFHGDFFFGFKEEGLFKMQQIDGRSDFEKIPVSTGVTCLLRDRFQDILWIGTAGEGVYTYSFDPHSIRSTLLTDITPKMRKPVTSLFLDDDHTLWIGSQGDGVLQLFQYDPYSDISEASMALLNMDNSSLQDNTVYAITGSKQPVVWVGTEAGLHYYSLSEKKMKPLALVDSGVAIQHIHAIYEQDSVLWIASAGMGIVKAHIQWKGGHPKSLDVVSRFTIRQADFSSNRFTAIYPENDSILWFANKGEGVFKVSTSTSQIDKISLAANTLNEVNSMAAYHADGYLMATNFGLVHYISGKSAVPYEANGLPNHTIHSILRESDANYWLGTNRGIVYMNPDQGTFRVFNHLNGLPVTEFSDGAVCMDRQNGLMLFGGVNGFVSVKSNLYAYDEANDYIPPVTFDKLSIFGKEYNIQEYISRRGNADVLELASDQNFFSISFTALDYINGNNYSYYYKLEGVGNQWIDNGNANTVSFTDFAPGNYTLYVKYFNKILNKGSFIYSFNIRILPPWYRTGWAYAIYLMLGLLLTFLLIAMILSRSKKKKSQLLQAFEQQHREEIYEAKLQFFTQIAHEFCTPLTLIYGPCERILSLKNLDKPLTRYAQVIRQNAKRLNALIQDLLAFQRIETGYEKPQVQTIHLSALVARVADLFIDLSDTQHIRLDKDVTPDMYWNSDEKFMVTILINLLSNAFKYTTSGGRVAIRLEEKDGLLFLTVSNTGKGIRPEEIGLIFSRHTILPDSEYNNLTASWSRNGLGLAISHRMVRLLGGTIEVESVPGEWTHFKVCLPRLTNTVEVGNVQPVFPLNDLQPEADLVLLPQPDKLNESRPTILVVDDDAEMRWFIGELFAGEFNVIPVGDPTQVAGILAETQPDVILCDIMMEKMDGITLTKAIKSDEQTAHIPLVIISARHEIEQQIEAMGAGAELYVAKPFHVDYLKTSVRRLLERKEVLKDYFASPFSAFELAQGKLTHKEHKKLLKQILSIINCHIHEKDLSVNLIASELNMSVRSLYRKMEDMGSVSLPDLIRDGRVNKAADLLLKSKMTTDEIIFHSGFSNRASFYRSFSVKFKCTPTEYKARHLL